MTPKQVALRDRLRGSERRRKNLFVAQEQVEFDQSLLANDNLGTFEQAFQKG